MTGSNYELVLGKILERAIESKEKVGQIYRRFAELFSHLPEIEDFWKKMSLNQITHADWLKEIRESMTEEQILSLPEVELVLKTHSIRNLFNKHSDKEIDNLHDAYKIAHELEFSEVNDLFKILSSELISSQKKKDFILAEIDEHRRHILTLPERFEDEMTEIKAVEGLN